MDRDVISKKVAKQMGDPRGSHVDGPLGCLENQPVSDFPWMPFMVVESWGKPLSPLLNTPRRNHGLVRDLHIFGTIEKGCFLYERRMGLLIISKHFRAVSGSKLLFQGP